MHKSILLSFFILFFTSCADTTGEKDVQQTIEHFCEAFFELDYPAAVKYCTADSRPWLAAYASTLSASDVDTIRTFERRPKTTILDIRLEDNTGTAVCKVENAVLTDLWNGPQQQNEEELVYTLRLHKGSDGKWKIKMEGPLQSEK